MQEFWIVCPMSQGCQGESQGMDGTMFMLLTTMLYCFSRVEVDFLGHGHPWDSTKGKRISHATMQTQHSQRGQTVSLSVETDEWNASPKIIRLVGHETKEPMVF